MCSMKFVICEIYFTQNLFIFYVNSIWYDRLIIAETIIWLCCYVKEKYVLYFKTLFCYWATFKWSEKQIFAKLFQCCFLNVKATPMNKLNFHFQLNIKVEKTLIYGGWINVILFVLFYQRRNNVDKHMSAQLSFSIKFQRWSNVVLSTLNWRNSIEVVSTLFYQRWNNVDKCTSAQLSFSIKYQRRNNVDECRRLTLLQRWINVAIFVVIACFLRKWRFSFLSLTNNYL